MFVLGVFLWGGDYVWSFFVDSEGWRKSRAGGGGCSAIDRY